ncbi:MAG: hypothetical protein J0M04_18955 [Verrucomicrobia bacterium]|nr:hypothetical protein [Verrucomicrobiota bacterium]
MNIAEYRALLSSAKTGLLEVGATVNEGGSEWCSFVEGSVDSRGVEIFCSDDRDGVTVDYFELGEALHGEWDFESLDLALEAATQWLSSAILPK